MQCWIWTTWGPISDNAEDVFGWSDGTVALFANWGPICYIPASFLFSWIMDTKGLRLGMIIGTGLSTFGALIRCFTATNPQATVLVHFGQILNAIAGPIAMAGAVKVSQEWFAPGERTTSTAIAGQANLMGLAVAFIVEPAMVPDAEWSQIQNLLWLQLALTAPTLVLTILYFPNTAPTPPSISAHKDVNSWAEFSSNFKVLFKNNQFLILAASYGLSSGFYSGWGTILNVNLSNVGYSETVAGYIGFAATLSGSIGGIALGYFADRVRNMKALISILFALAAVSFGYFAVACLSNSPVPNSEAVLIIAASLGGFFINSAIPLFYEMSVEVSHPVGEGTVGSMLTNINNLGCMCFLFVPIDSVGTAWMNWAMAGVCLLFWFFLFFLKEEYKRYELDTLRGSLRDDTGIYYEIIPEKNEKTLVNS